MNTESFDELFETVERGADPGSVLDALPRILLDLFEEAESRDDHKLIFTMAENFENHLYLHASGFESHPVFLVLQDFDSLDIEQDSWETDVAAQRRRLEQLA